MSVSQEIRKVASEEYDVALEKGGKIELSDVIAATARRVRELRRGRTDGGTVVDELVDEAVAVAVRAVDGSRTAPRRVDTLWDALDDVVPIEPNTRRIRRRMDLQDWTTHLANVSANLAAITEASARTQRRGAELLPYLARGADTEAAYLAWQQDHPGDDLR